MSSSDSSDAEEYEVEEIITHRKRNNKTEYLVKWKGYDFADNSWEGEESFSTPETLENYWKKQSKKKDVGFEKTPEQERDDRSETPDSESSDSYGNSPSPSLSTSSSASYASARSTQNTLSEIENTPKRKINKSGEGTSIRSKSLEKTINHSISVESAGAELKTVEEAPTAKLNTLAEHNEIPVSTQKIANPPLPAPVDNATPVSTQKRPKLLPPPPLPSISNNEIPVSSTHIKPRLGPPPPLPARKRSTKMANENSINGESSTNSSRSVTPLDNVTIRSKRSKTPAVETVEEAVVKVAEEPESVIVIREDPEVPQSERIEEAETLSQMEKGYPISQILSLGKHEGTWFALLQYRDSDVTEWVVYKLVKKSDPQAVIKFFEATYRHEHGI